ncbi:Lysyl-tRNA synthetase [Taphrina deformans PYCC 5710]|uniref:Lysyl-tRNA synthetase n=1 Tax=Taphrina deformans (strain PYCC 5710 / ATCC 11124 / CBS 356.35 / IMI 108563 / JCM 9778 / NBRC 8474) TaxID=1097556 RepID=R4XF40_TAPDE|nr:Lysyl-tRNA synthetase [Taphrina deformans PYCC 5710]|eukprot:CCG83081.1 Lysyl-tRNA synthetase [Taphrina deformans PYCC 5710]
MKVTSRLFSALPRIRPTPSFVTHDVFLDKYSDIPKDQKSSTQVTIRGRVSSKRASGQKLFFFDTASSGTKIQVVGTNPSTDVATAFKGLGRGDHVQVSGIPGRTERGEVSIYATEVIRLSQCHHRIPEQYEDYAKRMTKRHVDFMVNESSRQVILKRSKLISTLRAELDRRGFVELETPILQSSASGATARPFETKSVAGLDLQLKIAPELALKRAVIGGFDRVYEIGKSFRNEGISRRHNPEFTTCEFYQAYAGLEDLIGLTKELLISLEASLDRKIDPQLFRKDHFQRLDFTSTIEDAIGQELPTDQSALLKLFERLKIDRPEDISVANLYDVLSGRYIEPLCDLPTFVVNLPSALSPLAKSTDGISHRFELYVNRMELVNAYEEENDPQLQRQKFKAQSDGRLTVEEEDYCNALEWGLPPTGGFGMGIDRLVMLLTNTTRINETLLAGGIMNQPRNKVKSS